MIIRKIGNLLHFVFSIKSMTKQNLKMRIWINSLKVDFKKTGQSNNRVNT